MRSRKNGMKGEVGEGTGGAKGRGLSKLLFTTLHPSIPTQVGIYLLICLLLIGAWVGEARAQFNYHPVPIMRSSLPVTSSSSQIESLGDFNDDGFPDFMVGFASRDVRANFYFGGNPIDSIPDFTLPRARGWMNVLGDLNGDGGNEYYTFNLEVNDDKFFFNSGNMSEQPDFIFRHHPNRNVKHIFTRLGDLNQDGYDDLGLLIVNIPLIFKVMLGGPTYDTTWVWTKTLETGEGVSRGIQYASDLNGDGQNDLIEKVMYHSNLIPPQNDQWLLYLDPLGSDTVPDCDLMEHVPVGDYQHRKYGNIAIIPDITGDTYSDYINWDNSRYTTTDTLYIFRGGPECYNSSPYLKIDYSEVIGVNYVAYVGDVNKDGYGDLAICFTNAVARSRYGHIYFGGPELDTEADVLIDGEVAGGLWLDSGLPYLLEYGGDLDGNGVDDLLAFSEPINGNSAPFIFILDIDSSFASVKDRGDLLHPRRIRLGAAYPNPFNSSLSISYSSPTNAPLLLSLVDLSGRTLQQNWLPGTMSGKGVATIGTTALPSGNYFVIVGGNRDGAVMPVRCLK